MKSVEIDENTEHDDLLESRQHQSSTFLGLRLQAGISRVNVFSYYLLQFLNFIQLSWEVSFVTFILEDAKYYNLSKDETGSVISFVGMWAEIFIILQDVYMGVLIDTFGRKVPIVLGMMVSAASLACMPLFTQVYPFFFILRVLLGLGDVISFNIPLLPDYIHKDSLGLANAYFEVVIIGSQLFQTYGLLSIAKVVRD